MKKKITRIKNKTKPHWIKNWPADERPREKLFKNGEHTLSNTELLAILLRTGFKGSSAIDLARKVIQKFGTFQNMSHTDIRDWAEFRGLGKAKIAQIRSAVEIGRRLNQQKQPQTKLNIKNSLHVAELFRVRMRDLKTEIFKVILCDPRNRVIDVIEVAKGTPTGSNPIIREIISQALQKFASGMICMHNHPSGKAEPSREDFVFTEELRHASKVMDVKLLDHLIFGETTFYSFDLSKTTNYSGI